MVLVAGPNGATLNSFAGYVQSTIRLHPQLTAVLGGRVSYFDIDLPADREGGVSLGIDDLTGQAGGLTTNLRLTWEVNDHVSALLAVENLFDTSYREHGSGINAPGLNAIVALEARFSTGFP